MGQDRMEAKDKLNFICGLYLDRSCNARFTAGTLDELMVAVRAHAKEAHDMDSIPADKLAKITSRFSGLTKDSSYGAGKW